MNKLLVFAIAALGLIGTPALAADMAVKAPPPAPAPVYNWTGWYVGGNLGASFGRAKTDFNGAPILGTATPPGQITQTVQITPGFGFSDRQDASDGFIGGGQIGYNWQVSPIWVVGLEADFQGALERESANFSSQFTFFDGATGAQCGATVGQTSLCTAATSYQTQIDWFGTARARLGYVWGNGVVLSYLTGGLAYGEVKVNGTNTVSGLGCAFGGCEGFSFSQAFSHSQVNTGWVVGFGTEGKLLIPGWTYKIESLYVDLGTLDTRSVTSANSDPTFFSGGQVTTHTHFTDAILRLGVNYQFH